MALTVEQVIKNAEASKEAAKKASKAMRDAVKDVETLIRLGLVPDSLAAKAQAVLPKRRGESEGSEAAEPAAE